MTSTLLIIAEFPVNIVFLENFFNFKNEYSLMMVDSFLGVGNSVVFFYKIRL